MHTTEDERTGHHERPAEAVEVGAPEPDAERTEHHQDHADDDQDHSQSQSHGGARTLGRPLLSAQRGVQRAHGACEYDPGWTDLVELADQLAHYATADQVATLAPVFMTMANSLAARARARAFQDLAAGWTGSAAAFARHYGLSPQRVSKLRIFDR